ncbi:MAG: hypothetical protein WAQ27_06460 [Candidatus Microsaccharimonas sp.]
MATAVLNKPATATDMGDIEADTRDEYNRGLDEIVVSIGNGAIMGYAQLCDRLAMFAEEHYKLFKNVREDLAERIQLRHERAYISTELLRTFNQETRQLLGLSAS